MTDKNLLLRALRMNAIFSTASAALLLIGGRWVAAQLGLPGAASVYVTAGLLLLFALQLWNIVRTGNIHTVEIAGIVVGDLAWVVATIVLVALFYPSLTPAGLVLVDVVALVVLYFAIQQIRGLKAMRRAR